MPDAVTILIVDDSDSDRLLCRQYIQRDTQNTYRILEADTIDPAMELWRSQQPDVTLVDFNLRDGNGLKFLESIRAYLHAEIAPNSSFIDPKLPVIMLTGHGDERVAVNAMKLGAFDYLVKNDITEFSLRQSIHSLLEHLTLKCQLEQSRRREALINHLSLNIRQFLNLEDICQTVTQEIQHFLKADRTLIYKFNQDMSRRVVAETVIEPWQSCMNAVSEEDNCISLADDQVSAYKKGKILVASDIYNANFAECHVQMLEGFHVRANIVVPILLSESINQHLHDLPHPHDPLLWGLLIAHQCSAPRVWKDGEIQLLQQMSVQLAIAIQQAEIYQNLQNLNNSLEDQIQERTLALQTSENKLRSILTSLPDLINLFAEDGTYLESIHNDAAHDLIPPNIDRFGKKITELLPESIANRQIKAIQQAIVTREMQTLEQSFMVNNCLAYEDVRVVPFEDNSAIVVVRDISDRKYAEEELQRQYQRTQLLSEVTIKIRQSLKIDDILTTTVAEIQRILQVDRALICQMQDYVSGVILKETVTAQFAPVIGQVSASVHEEYYKPYHKGIFSKIDDIDTANISDIHAEFLRQNNVKADIVVPIMQSEQLWGLLIVNQCDRPRQWTESEIDLMQQLANQVAIAITQSQLIEALQKSEEQRRLSTDLSQVGTWDLDLATGKAIWNTNKFNLLGVNANEYESSYLTWRNRVHPDDLEWVEIAFINALENCTVLDMEYRIVQPQGDIYWVLSKGRGIYDQSGEAVRMVGVILDINDRKQMELALQNSLQRERMLNHFVQTIRNSLDLEVVFNAATNAIANLLNLEQVTIVQYLPERKSWKQVAVFQEGGDLFNKVGLEIPDEGNPFAERLKRMEIVQVDDVNEIEDEINRELAKNASGAWLLVPIIVNEQVWGSLSSRKTYNIKPWESQEIELAQAISNQLAIAIQQATLYQQLQLELIERKQTEIKLAQAKESAETANKAKSEFLANMSHEIRTPMNGVIGMAQLLATTPLSDDQKHFVQIILDSGDALLTIINDILDLSKIESGKLNLEAQEFNLIDTLNSACNLLSKQAFDKGINLRYQVQPNIPKMFIGDSSRLRQILINLIGNAIKFTERGSIAIAVSGKSMTANTYELRFAIADTGIGINSEHIGNLFKPFMQADTSINRQFGGTGLGLAICKRLVELMGGTIWVESLGNIGGSPHQDWNITRTDTPLQGSIFHFAIGLPVHASNQSIEASDSLASIDVEIIPEQLPIKILIVEDNILNQKITQLMLKKLGYESDIIENGQECLTILSNPNPATAYEIIFMDVQMPVMDGITATKRIRENLSSPHKPWIVALTADALADEQKACMDAGMNDFISKPVRIKEVSRAIAAYIQQQER